MADLQWEGESGKAQFDLSQFYQIFFEEAAENLDQLERMLLSLDLQVADDEELNGIFRCAHSIKGGAATFGFADMTELTHHMESLLDLLRRHELTASNAMVDVLLAAADAVRSQLARHQSGAKGAALDTSALVLQLQQFTRRPPATPAQPATAAAVAAPVSEKIAAVEQLLEKTQPGAVRSLKLQLGPLSSMQQLPQLQAALQQLALDQQVQVLDGAPEGCALLALQTLASDDALRELLEFHLASNQVQIQPQLEPQSASLPAQFAQSDQALAAPPEFAQWTEVPSASLDSSHGVDAQSSSPVTAADDDDFGFFDGAPGLPSPQTVAEPVVEPCQTSSLAASNGHKPAATAQVESSSIRVAVSKVDQLINLVGELVITQAMLAQQSLTLQGHAHEQLLARLADLERNTRDLQESVMSIRMIPMSVVFSRFPRMVRDLTARLGKKVDLITQGEATELDKGLIEKITDPLTHLLRNSVDHGIETVAERLAAGKPEQGTVTLSASHQGGSIVIEVRDDGRGLSREKILAKARTLGLAADEQLSDQDVWQLIFTPGFSTAQDVTDVSGRGVGMDVVKRNITELGGSVEIDSVTGLGLRVAVRLPLTLAIMDGMSVAVGDEVYILPLSAVIESLQVRTQEINTVAHGTQLVKVRDEYLPVVSLSRLFNVPCKNETNARDVLVVIESDGGSVALLVEELLGQHQVVVKNLELNFRKVPNVSGATILGDGTVALILDCAALVRGTRH